MLGISQETRSPKIEHISAIENGPYKGHMIVGILMLGKVDGFVKAVTPVKTGVQRIYNCLR